jgi:hypothetical protein
VNIAKLPELVQGIRSETAQRSPVNQGQRLSLSRAFARVFCTPVSRAVFHGAMTSPYAVAERTPDDRERQLVGQEDKDLHFEVADVVRKQNLF